MTTLTLTVTVNRSAHYSADDCDHAELLGVIRRALELSPELAERYTGSDIAVSVPLTMNMNADSYTDRVELSA